MDFLRSYFFKNEPLISWTFLSSKLDSPVIKNQNIGETLTQCKKVSPMFWLGTGESDFDERNVQLIKGSFLKK